MITTVLFGINESIKLVVFEVWMHAIIVSTLVSHNYFLMACTLRPMMAYYVINGFNANSEMSMIELLAREEAAEVPAIVSSVFCS